MKVRVMLINMCKKGNWLVSLLKNKVLNNDEHNEEIIINGGYIESLLFRDKELRLSPKDIVVFVGPNNSGKSRILKDVYLLSGKGKNPIVLQSLSVKKNKIDLEEALAVIAEKNTGPGVRDYTFNGKPLYFTSTSQRNYDSSNTFDDYIDLFVCNLDTEARLQICNPQESIRREDAKKHPIHYVARDPELRKWLSDNFKACFGESIIPDTFDGNSLPLLMGPPIRFDIDFEDEQDRSEAYAKELAKYPRINEQGDGIRSFVGILLYLMMQNYSIYLMDEPDSFLHPPQAKLMGSIIANSLDETQQAFISTHSDELIKGLLEAAPDRVKIVRVTRTGNDNHISILNNEDIVAIWKDPLLRYSNIMSSLFYEKVVLCESDSDCRLYSLIDSYLKQSFGKYSDTLFIHCGGKDRMPKIIKALKSLDIDTKVIVDLDVLKSKETLFRIISNMGLEIVPFKQKYESLKNEVFKNGDTSTIPKSEIISIIELGEGENLELTQIRQIKQLFKRMNKWDGLKSMGINKMDDPKAKGILEDLIMNLNLNSIYLVPVGELENFVPSINGHGNEWVDKVLNQYPDFSDPVYNVLTTFINDIDI